MKTIIIYYTAGKKSYQIINPTIAFWQPEKGKESCTPHNLVCAISKGLHHSFEII